MTNHSTTAQAMHTPAFQIPRPAGWWIIGDASLGLQVPLGYRPMWLHRTMTSLLLGWEWKDDD